MATVSVVMAVFNAERYIGEALRSIHEQTFNDLEVLLVDDGSTDGTLREAERFGHSLDLTIVRQDNAGPSAARNLGIRRARGRYCAFLDADDIMLPELLGVQAAMIEGDSDIGFVTTDVTTFDERGVIQQTHWKFSEIYVGIALDRLLLENIVTTSAVMARTERLIEAGLFNEKRRVAEDYELWMRMAAKWKVGIINRPLVMYRYSPGSLSVNRLYSALCALEVVEAFWNENPDYLRNHQDIYRRSLARHLTNVGSAAFWAGKRGIALGNLLRSLRYDPGALAAWKWIAKTMILSAKRVGGNSESSSDIKEWK